MTTPQTATALPFDNPVWPVGALCQAVGAALDGQFNPVQVRGEISGFTRAASGHCYFVLKDDSGQMRCALFRRAAGYLGFAPKDGQQVEVQARLGVYEPRGELQLVVEAMRVHGQGTLFEQFLRLKARLEVEGLFAAARKRPLVPMPRGIGLVTSLGAAALHDVVTALQRRVPHIPVLLAPASVQGETAPAELQQALSTLYRLVDAGDVALDVILLVRGGGALEDLWAFNDEALARTIAASPVPVIAGVGHETDFTIADFVADVRAPTPTAAAELAATPTAQALEWLDSLHARLHDALTRHLERQAQRLDLAAARLSRPSNLVQRQDVLLTAIEQRLHHALRLTLHRRHEQLAQAGLRLELLNPARVLQRGYAWLTLDDGQTFISHIAQAQAGQQVQARLADGVLDLRVMRVIAEDTNG